MLDTHDHGFSRPAAVAGSFYPADPDTLMATVSRLLHNAAVPPLHVEPRILISPHAGYPYSGPVAAIGFASLPEAALQQPVGMVGPSHFVDVPGMSLPEADAFDTPLGSVRVSEDLRRVVARLPGIHASDRGHIQEHSLEVQLPFLQVLNPGVTIAPVVTGDDVGEVATFADSILDAGSLVVISSDLSHYLDYRGARRRDARTSQLIVDLEPERLSGSDACGVVGIQGALTVARRRAWKCQLLDLRNSGDTAGSRDRVVGYGSFALGPAS